MKKTVFISLLVSVFVLSFQCITARGGSMGDVALYDVNEDRTYLYSHALTGGGNIYSGDLRIIPGISLNGVHNDNIYLGNGTEAPGEKEESDWITHVMPILLLDYDFPERGDLTFGYLGDYAFYSDN
ncbi:MAG: hypothetical protein JRI70_03255, partial [Deltaproteobacteria bacterium]|nr:hypothetical protein [Deltaproteobacteria bacterium]